MAAHMRAKQWRRPWGYRLLLLLCCTGTWPRCGSGQSVDVTGFSQDQQGLLTIKRAIRNWDAYYRRSQCTGWNEQPGADVCTWTGVGCRDGKVILVRFANNGFQHVGDIADVLYGASLLQNLERLHMVNQGLYGTLPSAGISFPKLMHIDLGYNYIQGTLPASWGQNAIFPLLTDFFISFNAALGGALPPSWGADGSSLAAVQRLQITNSNVTGGLPASWAAQMPNLRSLDVSSNSISGSLPAQWSAMANLTVLNLGRNVLTGTVPAAWSAPGSFPRVTDLQVYGNLLSGGVPSRWTAAAASQRVPPQLVWLDVANNNFSGPSVQQAPAGSGQPVVITSKEDAVCRPQQAAASLWYCGINQQRCGKQANVGCPDDTLALQDVTASNASQAGSSADMAALLQLRAAFLNWPGIARTELLNWDTAAGPMCGGAWQGVTCDVSGSVVGLNLAAPNPPALSAVMSMDEMMRAESPRLSDLGLPAAPVDAMDTDNGLPPGAAANATVRGSSPVQLRGSVSAVLVAAAGLPQLRALDLANQLLTGQLPAAVAFPNLETLRITNNDLTGSLPPEWGAEGAFPMLRYLEVSSNYRLTGPLPSGWGSSPGSMQRLQVLLAHDCNLTGTLPASWATSMPALGALELTYNMISGTLPPEWSGMGSLQSISVVGNRLTGTLPTSWGNGGAQSWPELQQLHVRANLITGTLPASWGNGGSMPALRNFTVSGNRLSGSIPASWADPSDGSHPRFPFLQSITLLPGNPGLCGSIPGGLTVLRGKGLKVDSSLALNGQACPGTAAGVGPSPAPSAGSAPVSAAAATQAGATAAPAGPGPGPNMAIIIGAVLGAVVGVTALAAMAIVYLMHRSQQGSQFSSPTLSLKNSGISDKGHMSQAFGPPHDSDTFVVPSTNGTIPFNQSPMSRGPAPHEGQPPPSAPPTSLPQIIDKDWELNLDALEVELDEQGNEVKLGHGAYGMVVKGRYRMAPVAIKKLRDQSPEQQAQFLREMSILRACHGNRHIVPFVGASIAPGNTILAMDYMEMGTLWENLLRKNRSGQHAFQFYQRGKKAAYEIALGLHCLHNLGVVHLDLKSSNVLMGADGTAKISDVGMAALLSKANRYLSKVVPAGTLAWVAPEVIMGERVTTAADMFSFGVVLWEIVTLERPTWPRGDLRDPRVPEECPQEIADLILRCNGPAPERPTAPECANILADFLPRNSKGMGRSLSSRSASA